MRALWLTCIPVLVLAGDPQKHSGISREGRHWVKTVTGVMHAEDSLKVTTRGSIILRGENRRDVAYSIRLRAGTPLEARAREMLGRVVIKAYPYKNWGILTVTIPPALDEAADIQLLVPNGLKEAALESESGSVEAYNITGAVYAKTNGGQVQVDGIGGWVKAGTAGGPVQVGRAGGWVKAISGGGSIMVEAAGGDAYLDTGGGEIYVRMAKGKVQASAGSGGNIKIERADQGAVLSTGGGLIEVVHSNGPVRANTGSGSIKVRSASDVQCTSGAGQIQLYSVHGEMHANTAMGSIVAELNLSRPLQDSMLSTSAGDITVYIPSKLAVTVEATNSSPGGYRIVSDFPEIRTRLASGNLRTEAQGALNGGGPLLRLVASGGTIYLRRRN